MSGEVIKIIRIANNLSISKLAELTGIPKEDISEMENGQKNISSGILQKIGTACSLFPHEIMELDKYYMSSKSFMSDTEVFQRTLFNTLDLCIKNKNKLDEIESLFIPQVMCNYKCFNELRNILKKDPSFGLMVTMGYYAGKVSGFTIDLWNKIGSFKLSDECCLETLFEEGFNSEHSLILAQNIINLYPGGKIQGGSSPALVDKVRDNDVSHYWVSWNGKIIDTSLMLIIDEEYAKRLGYEFSGQFANNSDNLFCFEKKK